MSIKITNGYILPSMSLKELHNFAQTFRAQIRELSKKLIIERMGNMCLGYIDFVRLPEDRKVLFDEMYQYFKDHENMKHSPLYASYQKMQEAEQRIIAEKIKKPEYDFFCDIVFFPMENEILAMLFAEQKSYIELFKEMPGVKPYPYWNNTDRPADLTEDQWKIRELKWKEAVGYTGVPSLEGLSVSCYNHMPFIDPNSIHSYITERFSMDIRTNNYASKIITLQRYNELLNDKNFPFGSADLHRESIAFLKTDKGQELFQKEAKFLSMIFKPEISSDDLATSLGVLANED